MDVDALAAVNGQPLDPAGIIVAYLGYRWWNDPERKARRLAKRDALVEERARVGRSRNPNRCLDTGRLIQYCNCYVHSQAAHAAPLTVG